MAHGQEKARRKGKYYRVRKRKNKDLQLNLEQCCRCRPAGDEIQDQINYTDDSINGSVQIDDLAYTLV
jgi:hypothetical protein